MSEECSSTSEMEMGEQEETPEEIPVEELSIFFTVFSSDVRL